MSIRHSLLALLQDRPRYGYQLRIEFEDRTGSSWPLNIGQVYTTLDRLERDGLVRKDGADGEGHVMYTITPAGPGRGRQLVHVPGIRANPPRNELAIKLALGLTLPGVRRWRRHPRPAGRVHPGAAGLHQGPPGHGSLQHRPTDTARLLVLDSLIFQTEAEVRWLDLCEARLMQLSNLQA